MAAKEDADAEDETAKEAKKTEMPNFKSRHLSSHPLVTCAGAGTAATLETVRCGRFTWSLEHAALKTSGREAAEEGSRVGDQGEGEGDQSEGDQPLGATLALNVAAAEIQSSAWN